MAKEKTATIVMTQDKECKGSVRYATADPDAVVTNVYLNRKFAGTMPKKITITVAAN